MRLVFVGECMVEIAPDGAAFQKGFAGDTFNMAWYAKQVCPPDWHVDYVSAIGDDAVSKEMAAFMTASGINIDHVQRRSDRTVGLYLISLNDGERSFSYWRSQSAARRLADDASILAHAFNGADVVCLSGITVAVLEAEGRAILADCLRDYRAKGGRVAFDPNIRPRLWTTPQDLRAGIMQFAALSDIVLASFEDEAAFFSDSDPTATLQRYQDSGAPCVIVKDGGNPVHAIRNGATVRHAPSLVEHVVDSTAAGDSFNAAFLVGLLKSDSLTDCLIRGAALSREVIQAQGALSEEAVRQYLSQ